MVAWEDNEKAAMQYLEHKYCLHCGKSLKSQPSARMRYLRVGMAFLVLAGVVLGKAMGWW